MIENTTSLQDSKGNKLEVAEMDPGDFFDLLEACAHNAQNRAWLAMASLVCSVRSINSVPITMPSNPDQVKALARKLGTVGLEALRTHADGDASARTVSVDADTVKN